MNDTLYQTILLAAKAALTNLAIAYLLFFTRRRVNRPRVRRSLFFYLTACLLWIDAGLFLRSSLPEEHVRVSVARITLGASVLLVNALSLFLLTVSDQQERETRTTPFRLFQWSGGLFFLLSFSPFVLEGLTLNNGILWIRFGPLYPLLILHFTLYGLFIFRRMARLKEEQEGFQALQIRYLHYTGLLSFIILLMDRGVVPALTGRSETPGYGFLGFLFLFLGALYLLINGEASPLRSVPIPELRLTTSRDETPPLELSAVSVSVKPIRESVPLDDYRSVLLGNVRQTGRLYGGELICFSPQLYETLREVEELSHSPFPVLFCGETGTGRTLMARSMHTLRGGGGLTEVSLSSFTLDSLEETIRHFLKSDPSRRQGLVLKHLECLPPGAVSLIHPLLESFGGKRYVYFTLSDGILAHPGLMPEAVQFALTPMRITLAPLRRRHEDLFHQLLWFGIKAGRSAKIPVTNIPSRVVTEVMEYRWPGNSLELQRHVTSWVMRSRDRTLRMPPGFPREADTHIYSPLEESERRVILEHLVRNNYNKSKTVRDLKITVNTLKAKMNKYNLGLE